MKKIFSAFATAIRYFLIKKEIQRSFISAGFAEDTLLKKDKVEKKIKEFKFKKPIFSNYIDFLKFNQGMTTLDFQNKVQLFNEVFNLEFIRFQRISIHHMRGYFANWDKEYKVEKWETCVGWNGLEKSSVLDELASYYLFGKMGSGKSTLIKSLIKQYIRVSRQYEVVIVSAKPSDFKEYKCLSYSEDSLKILSEKLDQIEFERQQAEMNQDYLKKRYIIVLDEIQYLDKENLIKINNLIRIGRSQKITTLLSSQSGLSTQFKELNLNLIAIKISVGKTESVALAETLFDKNFAAQTYHNLIPKGFGYIKTDKIDPQKIRFYYE